MSQRSIVYTCGTCGAHRLLRPRPGRVNLNKDCHRCAGKKARVAHPVIKHGGARTPLHTMWCSMKQRCSYPGHESWKDYGGRGITVCAEWRESFAAFRAWALANGYRRGLQIDRKDNDGNYAPDNCRWATSFINNSHKRSSRLTIADALVIRDLANRGVPTKLVAALYGVKMCSVSNIKSGFAWKGATLDVLEA